MSPCLKSGISLIIAVQSNRRVEEGKYIQRRFMRRVCFFLKNHIILLGFFLIFNIVSVNVHNAHENFVASKYIAGNSSIVSIFL